MGNRDTDDFGKFIRVKIRNRVFNFAKRNGCGFNEQQYLLIPLNGALPAVQRLNPVNSVDAGGQSCFEQSGGDCVSRRSVRAGTQHYQGGRFHSAAIVQSGPKNTPVPIPVSLNSVAPLEISRSAAIISTLFRRVLIQTSGK